MPLYDDDREVLLEALQNGDIGNEELVGFWIRAINNAFRAQNVDGYPEGTARSEDTWRFAVFGDEIRSRGIVNLVPQEFRSRIER